MVAIKNPLETMPGLDGLDPMVGQYIKSVREYAPSAPTGGRQREEVTIEGVVAEEVAFDNYEEIRQRLPAEVKDKYPLNFREYKSYREATSRLPINSPYRTLSYAARRLAVISFYSPNLTNFTEVKPQPAFDMLLQLMYDAVAFAKIAQAYGIAGTRRHGVEAPIRNIERSSPTGLVEHLDSEMKRGYRIIWEVSSGYQNGGWIRLDQIAGKP
jgi:hypothetical protein